MEYFWEWAFRLGLLGYWIVVERRLSTIEGYCKGRHSVKNQGNSGECGEGET